MVEEKLITRIPVASPDLSGNELKYVTDCIKSSWISSGGPYVKKFEEDFAAYCGCLYGISTSNGTSALHLAMLALGIGKDDEVIVPSLTFIASANTISHCGANPVFVDVDFNTWNMDPSKVEEAITPKTKAIMPVHLYGNPCNMDALKKISDKYGLFIIEDSAEAHGATINGKKAGSLSNVSCFSFFGNKTITTGEGGMCLTNDLELAEKMRLLRDHGMSKERRYWHEVLGFNYRMTNLQAAVGVAQLERLDEFTLKKIKINRLYKKYLFDVKGLYFQKEYPNCEGVCWMTVIRLDDLFGKSRDDVISVLDKNGIDARPGFPLIHEMPFHKQDLILPVSKEISNNSICLPSFVGLTEEQIRFICDKIKILT